MNSNRSLRGQKPSPLALLIPLLLNICVAPATNAAGSACERDIKAKLALQVTDYDNGGVPLIPTLLNIAESYDLPMGIERVTREALERPIRVKVHQASLSRLLDLCMGQLPGYSWALHDDVINVVGAKEYTEASNLFNLVVPSFEVHEQDLNIANSKLRMSVLFLKERPAGVVGSNLGSSEFEGQRLTFAARNTTVREILNRLVRLYGKSVWIARVPPERLSQLPQAGLWQILPRSVHDPRGLVEPFQE
jgi:hypothetical protein